MEPSTVVAALLNAALAISPGSAYCETFFGGAPFVVCAESAPPEGTLFEAAGIDDRVLCRSIDWSCFLADGTVVDIVAPTADD